MYKQLLKQIFTWPRLDIAMQLDVARKSYNQKRLLPDAETV